jgi:hypothetical protein
MNPALAFVLRNCLNGGLVVSVLTLALTIWISGVSQ